MEPASLLASRASALEEQKGRNGISTTLDAHRETLRQQRPQASATEAGTPAKPATDIEVGATGKGDDASIRLPGVQPATTAQQTVAEVQARSARADAPVQTASGMQAPGAAFDVRTQSANVQPKTTQTPGAPASGTATPSAATGTVLQSSSAVVTSVFGASDSAGTGEDVLTQRGAESFALPQLLAEASVRSGAASFRAETPRLVAQQLAEAVATNGKRNIDVSLNPRELGHVNMRVSTTETGVTVVIQAERQETEDLMRRHIQDLAREFKEMGFSDISFQFGSDTSAGQSEDGEMTDSSGGTALKGDGDAVEEEPQGLPLSQQLNISADGLDIRI
ncbi:flagellar hook-length control protein FliK [Phaeobacter sp. B1627]|uniref:flagellar hook-length control protein FliK n=1 Tax=Phaeobacter sp. B1627 TaxID=2583809 RepID=UPI002102DF8E|nr:flagellar hook-length control protein FliK [Phaeobacter sp. B1627]